MAGAAATMNDEKQKKSWAGFEDAKVYVASIDFGSGGKGERLRDDDASEAERTYTLFQHLVGLTSAIDGMGILGLIGAIIMWRIKAAESPFYDDHGREAVNFQISLLVYLIGGAIVLTLFSLITFGFGAIFAIPLAAIGTLFLFVMRFVGCIRGAIAANKGEYYRYPITMRFIG